MYFLKTECVFFVISLIDSLQSIIRVQFYLLNNITVWGRMKFSVKEATSHAHGTVSGYVSTVRTVVEWLENSLFLPRSSPHAN